MKPVTITRLLGALVLLWMIYLLGSEPGTNRGFALFIIAFAVLYELVVVRLVRKKQNNGGVSFGVFIGMAAIVSLLVSQTGFALLANSKSDRPTYEPDVSTSLSSESNRLNRMAPIDLGDGITLVETQMANPTTLIFSYQHDSLDNQELAKTLHSNPFMVFDICHSLLQVKDSEEAMKNGASFVMRYHSADGSLAASYPVNKDTCML